MWSINLTGEKEFLGGNEDWTGAARMAGNCSSFREDVDEEVIADEPRSCYNCRYRRWTAASFACQAPMSVDCKIKMH